MKKALISLLIFFAMFINTSSLTFAADTELFQFCNQNPSASVCADRTSTNPILHVIKVATNIIAAVAGVAAVIMIIASGIRMITSGGNQEAVSNARKRMTSAVIGIAIIALSWIIVSFAISQFIKT